MAIAALVAGLTGGAAPMTAGAQQLAQSPETARTITFSIPSQPLDAAIEAFVRATGWQISYSSVLAQRKTSGSAIGAMTPGTALERLIEGTGVAARIGAPGSVALVDATIASANVDDGEATELAPIIVTGTPENQGRGYQGSPDWVYETPDSVSVLSREAIGQSGARDTRDLMESVAGVYTGEGNGSFPTVSPNIRGLQDSGRVVVSIDGARQNAQDGGRYGGSSLGGIGMAFVDSAFVRQVEITKKTDASANNAGSLSGATDFKLVGADDIIAPGERWGQEFDVGVGTNAYHFDGSSISAARLGEHFAVTFGASQKRLGEYRPGRNGTAEARYDLTNRQAWSTLFKLEADYEAMDASIAWMHQQTDFAYDTIADASGSSFDVAVDTIVADVGWSPDTPLIDLSAKGWVNFSDMGEIYEARSATAETAIDKSFDSFGFILDNTSRIDTGLGGLTLNYGAEAFRDIADKSASSSAIAANPQFENSYGSWSPAGRRDVASAFVNGKLEPTKWVTLSAGLRYDWHRLKGSSTYSLSTRVTKVAGAVISEYDYTVQTSGQAYADLMLLLGLIGTDMGEGFGGVWHRAGDSVPDVSVTLTETEEIDRSDGAWLPSATVEFAPVQWFKPYVSYSQSFRPPTITEAFASGSISPMDRIGTSLAPNADLQPEKARTYEVGANVMADRLFTDEDSLRLKAAAFYREVDDFIVVGDYLHDVDSDGTLMSFVNLDGTARMRGLEFEGAYDAGAFWLGGTATFLDIDWPQKTDTFSNGVATTSGETIFWGTTVPPSSKVTLDAGVRFFDRDLALGGRANFVRPSTEPAIDSQGNTVEASGPYATMDLYGSFQITDGALMRFSVNNVTDVNYVPATGSYAAPGRTFQSSLQLKF